MTANTPAAKPAANVANWIFGKAEARRELLAGRPTALKLSVTTRTGRVDGYYLVMPWRCPETGELVGYRLCKEEGATGTYPTVYYIDITHGSENPSKWGCDCPSAQYGFGACKHARGLGAALAAIDLLRPY